MISSVQCSAASSTATVNVLKDNSDETFNLRANQAQYKESDYSNAVRVERSIPLHIAQEIAAKDSSIDYFCFVKGGCMVLETAPDKYSDDPLGLVEHRTYVTDAGQVETGHARIFNHGDVVFFNNQDNKMWLGEANGLCDTYIKS